MPCIETTHSVFGLLGLILDCLSPNSIYFLPPSTIIPFRFFVASAVADYSKDRVEGGTPTFE